MDIRDLYKDYKNFIDKTIEINGWIKNHRKQAHFGFIDLTDGTSFKTLQVVYEEDKCDELLWADVNNLPEPFINYEGVFLEDKTITTYDCLTDGAYVKKLIK